MTDQNATAENIAAVAGAFVAMLQRDLTAEQWAVMRIRNAHNDAGVCASHDFIDANMTMLEAFSVVMGGEPDFLTGVGTAGETLWNEAWGRAVSLYLTDESTLESLTAEWESYCERESLSHECESLPHECALATLMFSDALTDAQRPYVAAFVARWDESQRIADKADA